MSEEEFARLIEGAVGTLRIEAGGEESCPPSDVCLERDSSPAGDAYEPEATLEVQYTIEESYLLVGYTESNHEISDPPEEVDVDAIEETTDVAAIAAKLVPLDAPIIRPPSHDDALMAATPAKGLLRSAMVGLIACALLGAIGWRFTALPGACHPSDPRRLEMAGRSAADALAARIVIAESGGDAAARNQRSSATGAGQFLDGTWLDMIRAHRPDLAEQNDAAILDLRADLDLSREMVARFAEGNAAMLGRRCLPVTPGTLYLAHFAGGAGATAVLSAPEYADAAATIAEADASKRLTREMIVTANPFLESFTVADLKLWADRKMVAAGGHRLSSM